MRAKKVIAMLALLASALPATALPDASAKDAPRQDVPRSGASKDTRAAASAAPVFASAWRSYRDRFVQKDGRVVDNGNRGISHSESQGYGLLLAAAAQDREAFERIWSWTLKELYIRPDGLAAWRWDPSSTPHVTDMNNASDGDLLIAWALGEAAERWSVPAYRAAMSKITGALFKVAVKETPRGLVLMPGADGFGAGEQPDGPVVNLSYWVFPAIDRLEALDPGHPWKELRRTGLALAEKARFGPLRLPSEWMSLAKPSPVPASSFPKQFGYNAIRIPLYLAWSAETPATLLAPYRGLWNAKDNIGPFTIELDTGAADANLDAPGYRLIFAALRCIQTGTAVPLQLLREPNDLYYPATLSLLSILAISERRPQCL